MNVLSEIPVLLQQLPQPVIAAVNGPAAGIGFALALAADIAIAATSAKFVNGFLNAGTGHELGMSYLLPRAVGTQKAAEILFTRRAVLADEAERIGLVLKVVPGEDLLKEALALAESISATNPLGIWFTKQSFHLNRSAPSLSAAIELENRAVHLVQQTGDMAEQREAMEGKRSAVFRNQ
jgi:enoyl-CoA hydratase